MKSDVSRRNFVAVAGAGIALAACKGREEKGAQTQAVDTAKMLKENEIESFLEDLGLSNEGQDPNFAKNPIKSEFKPKYIAICHIRSPRPWVLKISHAHYETKLLEADNTPEKRLEIVLEILKEKLKPEVETQNNKRPKKFSNLAKKPFEKGTNVYSEYENFRDLGFNSKHEIFVFYESPNIGFVDKKLVTFSSKLKDGGDALPNDSFFNARIVKDDEIPNGHVVKKIGQILRLENHFLDANGNELTTSPDPEKLYSMNFVYQAPSDDAGDWVPMIIDPDTGNGMGNNP